MMYFKTGLKLNNFLGETPVDWGGGGVGGGEGVEGGGGDSSQITPMILFKSHTNITHAKNHTLG